MLVHLLLFNKCQLVSGDIHKMNCNVIHLKETQDELQKSLEVLMARSASENLMNNVGDGYLPPDSLIEDFPIASLEKFNSMEQKLEEKDFLLKCVSVFFI